MSATASPAVAKGPTDVAVDGPGVDHRLSFTQSAAGVDLGTLGEAARIYELWNGKNLAAEQPLTDDELGPRFVLTWTVSGMEWAVQHAYPFAEGGAWVKFFPNDAKAGWATAPELTEQLVALGAAPDSPKPVLAPSDPSTSAAEAPAPASGDDDDSSSYPVLVPAALLLVGAVVAGAVIARRRRLSP